MLAFVAFILACLQFDAPQAKLQRLPGTTLSGSRITEAFFYICSESTGHSISGVLGVIASFLAELILLLSLAERKACQGLDLAKVLIKLFHDLANEPEKREGFFLFFCVSFVTLLRLHEKKNKKRRRRRPCSLLEY